jgi:hypothetical protein
MAKNTRGLPVQITTGKSSSKEATFSEQLHQVMGQIPGESHILKPEFDINRY